MQIQIYEIGVCLSESETRKLQEISEEIAQKDMLDRYKDRKSPPEVFSEKVFWKYAENLQENTHVEALLQ